MADMSKCEKYMKNEPRLRRCCRLYDKIRASSGGITERIPWCDALRCFRDGSRNEGQSDFHSSTSRFCEDYSKI